MIAGTFIVDPAVAALIGAASVAGAAMTLWRGGRLRALRVILNALVAAALLAALSLPDAPATSTLVVVTPGATRVQVDAAVRDEPDALAVALPGAAQAAFASIERVPDLATALRRHDAPRLVVIGEGLREHDRAAVGARALAFVPSLDTATALVQVDAPTAVTAGAWWTLSGRVRRGPGDAQAAADSDDLRVVLRDPGGVDIASAAPDADGGFALRAVARAAGSLDYTLHLRRGDATLQSMPVPIRAEARAAVRALVLAAAPSPELKYLRRWALDAGVPLETRVALAPGLAQRRGAAALGAAELAELDLLVVDERSWAQLASLQSALREAVQAGLGLLVRTTGPVPPAVAREWTELGIAVTNATKPIALDAQVPGPSLAGLHAWPIEPASQAQALLADAAGVPVADWRALGRGRIGSWRVADTHRWYTRGERARHATAWSQAWSALARARGEPLPELPRRAVSGKRATVCGVIEARSIQAPSGARIALAPDDGCAAFWPRERGWHRLEGDGGGARFFVHDPASLASVLGEETRVATQARVRETPKPAPGASADPERRRAAWLALWLALAAVLWALERRA